MMVTPKSRPCSGWKIDETIASRNTRTFIWALTDDPELGTFAKSLLVDSP